ncbi:decapping endonuclease targeting mRNA [Ceratobasidium sp. 428]|nr:decapping endonuclease targeting mRNA [Ceratobasidium sp. 428]
MSRRKLLKFWAQSFLLGIPEIVVGFRTHQGRLSTLQTFQTLGLPRMVRGKPGAWDPNVCLTFAGKLLRFVRGTLEADNREYSEATATSKGKSVGARERNEKKQVEVLPTLWRLSIQPNTRHVVLRKLSQQEVDIVRNGEDRIGFLPTWFYNSVMDIPTKPVLTPEQ